jgi:hypothetical protein
MGDPRSSGSGFAVGARRSGGELPSLSRGTGQATAATRDDYFVTSPCIGMSAGDTPDASGGPLHAKAMGTLMTACGLNATSWPKLWTVPFFPLPKSACPSCAHILGERSGHRDLAPGS